MDEKIKFSIMAPVYNVENYLDECIQSVLEQSYRNYELILVDDGSTDGSGRLCDEYAKRDGRIRVFHKENEGLVLTRDFALRRVEGDYCVFLDSDDWLEKDALAILAENIRKTDCDCVIYNAVRVSEDGEKIIHYIRSDSAICGKVFSDRKTVYSIVLTALEYNSLWRKCVRSTCFDGRNYSAYRSLSYGEDLVRSFEIYENAKTFLFIDDVLYMYRWNNTSITRSYNYDDAVPDNSTYKLALEFAEKMGVFTQEDYARLANLRLDALLIDLRRIARECSSKEKAIETMKRYREDEINDALVTAGYRAVQDAPGYGKKSPARQLLLEINLLLFKKRQYRAFIALDNIVRRI